MCAQEFDRKIFISTPYGASVNNRVMIWDLEKENWNPNAFNMGFQQFVRYSDNAGLLHLLAIPTTPTAGNYITEINESFTNDNGLPFQSEVQTGLIHVTPDHVQFAHINYVFYELGSPNGVINLDFSGTPKNLPLSDLAAYPVTLGDSLGNTGFSTYAFSSEPFSFDSVAPLSVGQLSVKERIRINKLINNWEADVNSNTVGTQWTLNQVIVTGQLVPTATPSSWIVN
jgi:hypothetical protein